MKILFALLFLLSMGQVAAQSVQVAGPDSALVVDVRLQAGVPVYSVNYNQRQLVRESPLGLRTNVGDFSRQLSWVSHRTARIDEQYTLNRCKTSAVHYQANETRVSLRNAEGKELTLVFRVSDNDVAFRYELPRYGDTGSVVVLEETTGFRFPTHTTTFLSPQSDPMIGWKRSKPSYEEEYVPDAPLTAPSQYGRGYTFPALYHVGDDGWVLVSETGVDSRYCASHLSEHKGDGLYTIAFPMPEENNGNGTVSPGFALPGATPWRTLTVGCDLRPIVETTVPWDVVSPLYETQHKYRFGRGTWSWIVWQDASMNYDDQITFIHLARDMGYEYILIDAGWDKAIGYERMKTLVDYAHRCGVDVFLWFSSSGYWNDIVQSPINVMDRSITRKAAMRWMQELGVKGIKVDFFGGDKQETMRLYEDILSDADDHGLMVIFHGCTLPRGWERMYPNYVGSEAVLASENMVFQQHFCDQEAFNAALHPFCRNAVGSMEFGGCFMNRRLDRSNQGGTIRRTTDAHELATSILFQNSVQMVAVTPNNLLPEAEGGAPAVAMDFLKNLPTVWDETRFIEGYPGRYVVLARRSGTTWYVAGTNATERPLTLRLSLPMLRAGERVQLISDRPSDREPMSSTPKLSRNSQLKVTLQPGGGFVLQQ